MYTETAESDDVDVISTDTVRLVQLDGDTGRLIVQIEGANSLKSLQTILNGSALETEASVDERSTRVDETAIETGDWELLLRRSDNRGFEGSTKNSQEESATAGLSELPVADSPQEIKDAYNDSSVSVHQFRELIFGTLHSNFSVGPQVVHTAESIAVEGRTQQNLESKDLSHLLASFYIASRIENDTIPISWLSHTWGVLTSEEKILETMNDLKAALVLSIPPVNPASLITRIVERLPDEAFGSGKDDQRAQLIPTAMFIAGYFFSDGVCQTKNSLSVAGASVYIADTLLSRSLTQEEVAAAAQASSRSIARAYPELEDAISELPFSLKPGVLDEAACLHLQDHTSRELVTTDLDPVKFTTLKGMYIDHEFIQSLPAPREYSESVR